MSTREPDAFPIIPKSNIGKILLGMVLLSFIATGLSVFGVIFNSPQLIGPFPETAFWHYFWYGILHLVLVITYFYLFKPWADSIDDEIFNQEETSSRLEELEAVAGE